MGLNSHLSPIGGTLVMLDPSSLEDLEQCSSCGDLVDLVNPDGVCPKCYVDRLEKQLKAINDTEYLEDSLNNTTD